MEVTLAVAIIGVAIAVLLGLFPVGIQAGRDAADTTMAAALANNILSTLQAAAAASFTNTLTLEFATVTGATAVTIYHQTSAGMLTTNQPTLNLQTLALNRFGTMQPYMLFFDSDGRQTSNTGTGAGTQPGQLGVGTLSRPPYYRAEITLTNNSTIIPGTNLTTVFLQIRWPCVSGLGSFTGWRPRRGGPSTSGTFTDRTANYFGIVVEHR